MKVNASNFFKSVGKEPDQFYVIHYSSQSLYDADSEGHSPRITSIAVMHFATRQTTSFSVHAVADLLRIGKDEVETNYNDIEKQMLLRFFDFVRDRLDKYWIHWRMQNLKFAKGLTVQRCGKGVAACHACETPSPTLPPLRGRGSRAET